MCFSFRSRAFVKCFSAVSIALLLTSSAAGGQPAPNLPTIAELEDIAYEPTLQPELVGMPSYQDLKDTIYSFQNYLRGAELLAKFEEPVLTRGASGIAIYRKASPAVVLVFAGNIRGEQLTEWGMGTGVIVGPAGYVLTNWHVVKGFQGIVVLLKPPGGAALTRSNAYDADLINYYREKDLALLKLVNPPSNLTVIETASASQLQVAQDIHVIGHPGGIEHAWSYTTGVVSQTRPHYETRLSAGQEIRANVIQIQVAVNPGNSGGPVLDDQGKMVGLISFGHTENMNFAIAADEISTFLSYAMRTRTRGITAQAPDSPEAEYSVDLLLDGRRVIRASYPDMVVYFVHEDDGKVVGLVANASNGVVLQAWEPGPTGGFNQWLAKMPEGTTVEGTGKAGLPDVFVSK